MYRSAFAGAICLRICLWQQGAQIINVAFAFMPFAIASSVAVSHACKAMSISIDGKSVC